MTHINPIFGYDDRYFLDCEYTEEELFELQNQILSIISSGSSDIRKEIKTKINDKEIDIILRQCYSKQLVQRERLGVETNDEKRTPIYRYFAK